MASFPFSLDCSSERTNISKGSNETFECQHSEPVRFRQTDKITSFKSFTWDNSQFLCSRSGSLQRIGHFKPRSLSRHQCRLSHDFMFASLSNMPPFLPREGKISRFVPFNFVHGSALDRRTQCLFSVFARKREKLLGYIKVCIKIQESGLIIGDLPCIIQFV